MPDSPFTPTPEMIAAAWDAWKPRRGDWRKQRMGSGPAFKEATQAALAKMPAGKPLTSQEPPNA